MPEEISILDQYSTGKPPVEKDISNVRKELLAARAAKCASTMVWLPRIKSSPHFLRRFKKLDQRLQLLFALIESAQGGDGFGGNDCRWLCENLGPLHSALASLAEAKAALTRTVYVRYSGQIAPRVLVVAEDLLASLDYRFDDCEFSAYLHAIQSAVVLRLDELRAIVPALQCVLLRRIAVLAKLVLAKEANGSPVDAGRCLTVIETCIRSLREIDHAPWQELLEPLIVFDAVLRCDPAEAYARMDPESQEMYRAAVVNLAQHSDHSELEVAELALSLARESQGVPEDDPVLAQRRAHVGYYLIAEGLDVLRQRAHVSSPFRERWQRLLRRYPNDFYLVGIEVLTLIMISAAIVWGDFDSQWAVIFFAALALLLPCSEGAVQIMNYLTSSLLPPQILPKLDFRKGIPDDCTTMVVVPTLLLDEKQVRQLVGDLEVRYLGNMSANLHFALLTDLPDSEEQPRDDESIVGLCGQLIRELNEKYAGNGRGTFAMFHRHGVYNAREGVWMGWERKRGKLLDFNRLVLGEYDSFPYKGGDLSVLPQVRYVLTVDADTELPRGTAQRLIGTLAHPLCWAIIDHRNVVTHGYGVLQPRVAVSFESAAQSRLASIYSGQAGFDIYTHATSDVYQDLYGEGTFVGKGLYDLRTVHRVLDQRFPRNAILSHDLIEGAYARAGLVSDVEIVDRYPSHYSAYTRRKHRWIRGDWQIVEWLLPRVPDEVGRRVPNPISLISRWKIVDNLRRSMVGPATLVLFILGWSVLPGKPLYWTAVSISILFLPPWFQFAEDVARALFARSLTRVGDACASLATAFTGVLLVLTFLIHDALVSLDAAFRSSYRWAISRERLLEWETAAEAELGIRKRSSLDLYLACTPVIASAIGAVLLLVRPPAFWVALPVLVLWACSMPVSVWLDGTPRHAHDTVAAADKIFLRLAALRTWRYFAEFSSSLHHWLVPDSVQEEPANVAARVSPTNLGFLLNARQIACELGYLTAPEFVEQTQRTLETMSQLRRHRGHFLNWYDTRTLLPEPPLFVSSVDSGNLAASLIALKVGCNALLEKPLLSPSLVEGYVDHLRLLDESKSLPERPLNRLRVEQEDKRPWLEHLVALVSEPVIDVAPALPIKGTPWFATQLQLRREQVRKIFDDFMPWLLPEFESVRRGVGIEPGTKNVPSLTQLPDFVKQLQTKLLHDAAQMPASEEERNARERLLALLPGAYERSGSLARDLRMMAAKVERWVVEMDFGFLLEQRRKLLSVGYHLNTGILDPACYDLLASEARIAAFIAIGKGDVPQDTWFRLGRAHVSPRGGLPTLISWAGTMFEYLMPAIWMRSQHDTLLRHSMQGAVRAQKAYAAARQIPWGISEAGYSELDDAGMYRYAAMGVPELALREPVPERLVVAPYATAMALAVAPADALNNLRRMAELGWLRAYGFYEAADFGATENSRAHDPSLVKAWMAHHQGMILLSIGNFLCGNIVQQWFHSDAQVRATELLLHERPVLQHVRPVRRRPPASPIRLPQRSDDEPALAS
jgi:cyclic beta-1,2-glucan synthetase